MHNEAVATSDALELSDTLRDEVSEPVPQLEAPSDAVAAVLMLGAALTDDEPDSTLTDGAADAEPARVALAHCELLRERASDAVCRRVNERAADTLGEDEADKERKLARLAEPLRDTDGKLLALHDAAGLAELDKDCLALADARSVIETVKESAPLALAVALRDARVEELSDALPDAVVRGERDAASVRDTLAETVPLRDALAQPLAVRDANAVATAVTDGRHDAETLRVARSDSVAPSEGEGAPDALARTVRVPTADAVLVGDELGVG